MLPKLGKERNGNSSNNLKGVGLGILVHRSPEPNLVVKQSRKLAPSSLGFTSTNSNNPCFLKTCFLCNKNLNPHEDIYMYRQCHKNEPGETRLVLEDLRRQHNRLPHPRIRPVVS